MAVMYPGFHSDIMLIETEEPSQEEYLAAFQRLVDSGMAWELQGFYGRTAQDLISAGLIQPALHTGDEVFVTPEFYDNLKAAYDLARRNGAGTFEFQDRVLLTDYAKYVLEYLEDKQRRDNASSAV